MRDRVVITGIGVVSSLGVGREAFWSGALAGRTAARRLENPWIAESDLQSKIGAPVDGFDPVAAGIEAKRVPFLDLTAQFALAAAIEATRDARWDSSSHDPFRVAVVVGSGIGGLGTYESQHALWRANRSKLGTKRLGLPMIIPNAPAGEVAVRFGARGECKAIATACAAGTMAIGDAYRLLVSGEADAAIAGGAEAIVSDVDGYAILGFERLRTLSRRNEEPERASRPFDRERDGFVPGEGSAIVVLERESAARSRGVRPYAAILGYAANGDAVSMAQLDETGEGIVRLIGGALAAAGRDRSEVDHVSAHGTSTIPNDRTEARALRAFFGAGIDDVTVTALKSMTGHAIAGSGPMETAAVALAMRDGRIAPTINQEFPDPECELPIVANRAREARPRLALKLSYGFGGHNACLVLEPAAP